MALGWGIKESLKLYLEIKANNILPFIEGTIIIYPKMKVNNILPFLEGSTGGMARGPTGLATFSAA